MICAITMSTLGKNLHKIYQFYKKAFVQYPFSIKNMKPLINLIRQLRRAPNA